MGKIMDEVTTNQDLLWGVDLIAKFIGRDAPTTRLLLSRGDVPGRKVGKRWLSTKSVLSEPSKWPNDREIRQRVGARRRVDVAL
jgi:hypothetical protein